MDRNKFWALALVAPLAASCGGAPVVTHPKVDRAPSLSLAGITTVSLDVKPGACLDTTVRPEGAHEQTPCAESPWPADLAKEVKARIKARLQEAGVATAGKDTPPDSEIGRAHV